MSEEAPVVEVQEPPPWDFGDAGNKPEGDTLVTKADLAAFAAQFGRPKVDPASYANDDDREIAGIVEALEKQPVEGLKKHTQHIVNAVVKEVSKLNNQNMGQLIERQETPALRATITAKLCKGLGDDAKEYVESYLSTYNMAGLQNINADKKTLDTLRYAAQGVENAKRGAGAGGSGGTTGGTGGAAAGAGLTGEQEADAQEMFKNMAGVKGYTIEKARDAVRGVSEEVRQRGANN